MFGPNQNAYKYKKGLTKVANTFSAFDAIPLKFKQIRDFIKIFKDHSSSKRESFEIAKTCKKEGQKCRLSKSNYDDF